MTFNDTVAEYIPTILEVIYCAMGFLLGYTAYKSFIDKTNPVRIGTGLFWGLLAIIFIFGSHISEVMSGALVCMLALLTLFKQVRIGSIMKVNEDEAAKQADKLGNSIFVPLLVMSFSSMLIAQFLPSTNRVVIGFGALFGTIVTMVLTKATFKTVMDESDRMIQSVSTTSILPQLLGALGSVFAAAGVGEVIANLIGNVVPDNSRFIGVVAYVLGMVIFTMIMGNAFAAFAVITAGIGVPFVFALGANPVVAGALAMTAGFCGTLMTPMAGNFNALPAALLEMKSEYSVIKQQIPMGISLIIVHIALMYFWAF